MPPTEIDNYRSNGEPASNNEPPALSACRLPYRAQHSLYYADRCLWPPSSSTGRSRWQLP